jgi:hypothetical protein
MRWYKVETPEYSSCSLFTWESTLYLCDYEDKVIWRLSNNQWDEILRDPNIPSSVEHCFVHNNALFLFTPTSPLYSLNLETLKSHELPRSFGTGFMKYSMVLYNDGGYMYGGKLSWYTFHSPEKVLIFDCVNHDTFYLKCKGNCPPARCDHAATLINDRMYIYGGQGKKSALSDMWYLNLQNMMWTQVHFNCCLPGRRQHICVSSRDYLYIFGGNHRYDMDFLYEYDTIAQTLRKIDMIGDKCPDPNENASAVIFMGDLYICGGDCD